MMIVAWAKRWKSVSLSVSAGRRLSFGVLCGVVVVACVAFSSIPLRAQCVGDCNGDDIVDIADLTLGIRILIDAEPLESCPSYESISDLIQSVCFALNGCSPDDTAACSPEGTPTSTPTATVPGTPPPPTDTPSTRTPSRTATRTVSTTVTRTVTPTITRTLTASMTPTPNATVTATLLPGQALVAGFCCVSGPGDGGQPCGEKRRACPPGTTVEAYRCIRPEGCVRNERLRELLGSDPNAGATFSIPIEVSAIGQRDPLFIATIAGELEPLYDIHNIGGFPQAQTSGQSPAPHVIDPDTTGFVRAVDADGLETFSDDELRQIRDRTQERQGQRTDSTEVDAQRAQEFAETLIEPQLRIETSQDGRVAYYIVHNNSIFDYAITTVAVDGGGGDGGVNSCEVRGFTPGGGAVGDDIVAPDEVFVATAIPSAQSVGFFPGAADGHGGRVCPGCSDSACESQAQCDRYGIDENMVRLGAAQSPLPSAALTPVLLSFGTCTLLGDTLAFGEPPPADPTTRLPLGGAGPGDGFPIAREGGVLILASETTINALGFGIGGFRLDRDGLVVKGVGIDVDAPSGRRQLEFEAREIDVDLAPRALVATDLDGDDRDDLILVDEGSGQVAVQINSGDATFAPATGSPYPVGAFPVAVAIADLTRDQLPDIATADEGSASVSILRNTIGGFAPQQRLLVDPFPVAIALGNVGGDAAADIVTVHEPNGLAIRLNAGGGAFELPELPVPQLPQGSYPSAVAIAQLDGKGADDIVVANSGTGNVSVLLDGAESTVEYGVVRFPNALVAADLDRDGDLDLAATSATDNVVAVVVNEGGGVFGGTTLYGLAPRRQCVGLQKCPSGIFPSALTAGDIDADDLPDLLVVNEGAGDLTVLLGRGREGFDPARHVPVPDFRSATVASLPFPILVATGGFDSDSGQDLVYGGDSERKLLILLQR